MAVGEEDTIDIRTPALVLLVSRVNVHLRRLRESLGEQKRALPLYRRQSSTLSAGYIGDLTSKYSTVTSLGARVGCPAGAPPWNQPTSLQLVGSQYHQFDDSGLDTYTNHCQERNSLSILISVHSDWVASYVPKHSLVVDSRMRKIEQEKQGYPTYRTSPSPQTKFSPEMSASSGIFAAIMYRLTISHKRSLQKVSPCFRGMPNAPSTGRSADTIFHLQSVAKLEEPSIWTCRRARTLPVSKRGYESRCDIVKMGELAELECVLEEVDGGQVVAKR